MNPIVIFFRDYLSGTTYTITTVLCSIFICACLGYLIDKKNKTEKEQSRYTQIPSTNDINTNSVSSINNQVLEPEVLIKEEAQPKEEVPSAPAPSPTPTIDVAPSIEESVIDKGPIQPIEEIIDVKDTEPIIEEESSEAKKVQAPIPIQNTIEKSPKGIEEPLLPSSNNQETSVSNPIPVIK